MLFQCFPCYSEEFRFQCTDLLWIRNRPVFSSGFLVRAGVAGEVTSSPCQPLTVEDPRPLLHTLIPPIFFKISVSKFRKTGTRRRLPQAPLDSVGCTPQLKTPTCIVHGVRSDLARLCSPNITFLTFRTFKRRLLCARAFS